MADIPVTAARNYTCPFMASGKDPVPCQGDKCMAWQKRFAIGEEYLRFFEIPEEHNARKEAEGWLAHQIRGAFRIERVTDDKHDDWRAIALQNIGRCSLIDREK